MLVHNHHTGCNRRGHGLSHGGLALRLPGSAAASLRWSAACHPECRPARA